MTINDSQGRNNNQILEKQVENKKKTIFYTSQI